VSFAPIPYGRQPVIPLTLDVYAIMHIFYTSVNFLTL